MATVALATCLMSFALTGSAAAAQLSGTLELTENVSLNIDLGQAGTSHATVAISAVAPEVTPNAEPWQFRSLGGSITFSGNSVYSACSATLGPGTTTVSPSFYQKVEGEPDVTVGAGVGPGVPGLIVSSEEGGQESCSAGALRLIVLNIEDELANQGKTAELERLRFAFEPNGEVPASGSHVINGEAHVSVSDQQGDTYAADVSSALTVTIGSGQPATGQSASPAPNPTASGPTAKEQAEAARKKIKEAGGKDFVPAFDKLTAGAGLETLIDFVANRGLSKIVTEVAGPSARFVGEGAMTRVLNDYRIVEDPPARDYTALADAARPRTSRKGSSGPAGVAAAALAAAGARTGSVTAAMVKTIDRDSGAIKAGDYKAAEEQVSNFTVLQRELRGALSKQDEAAKALTKILAKAGLKSTLNKSQDAKLLGSLEQSLAKKGLSTKELRSLVGPGALKPGLLNVFAALTKSAA
jgi:hypothetical protein